MRLKFEAVQLLDLANGGEEQVTQNLALIVKTAGREILTTKKTDTPTKKNLFELQEIRGFKNSDYKGILDVRSICTAFWPFMVVLLPNIRLVLILFYFIFLLLFYVVR